MEECKYEIIFFFFDDLNFHSSDDNEPGDECDDKSNEKSDDESSDEANA